MIGNIISGAAGAAMKIGGAIAGGRAASRAAKRAKGIVEGQMKENNDWFDRRYNEDATQRADAQRLLTMTQESIRNRNRQAAGTAAVMGGTNEAVAAEKAANNQALADTMSQINAAAADRKDQIEGQYRARNAGLNQQLVNIEQNRAQNIAAAASGVGAAGDTVADMGDALNILFKKKQ